MNGFPKHLCADGRKQNLPAFNAIVYSEEKIRYLNNIRMDRIMR